MSEKMSDGYIEISPSASSNDKSDKREDNLLRTITDSIPALISYVDADHRYRFVNQTYTDWFGRDPEQIIGRHISEVLGESAYAEVLPFIERVLAGEELTFERLLAYKDGSERYVLINYVPDAAEDGTAKGYFALVQDISKWRNEELNQKFLFDIAEKIRQSENPDDLIFEIVQAVGRHLGVTRCLFMEIDLEIKTAKIYKDFLGKDLPPLEGRIPLSQFSPASIEVLRSGRILINDDIKNNPRTADFYETGYKHLGMEAFVGVPLLRDGRWIDGLAVVQDKPRRWRESEISLLETVAERLWLSVEKLRLNNDLRQSREVMRLAMESANIYSWQFDVATGKVVFSGDVKKVIGFALPENFDDLVTFIHEEDREIVLQDLREVFENRSSYNRETRYVNPQTGETVWLQTQGAFIQDKAAAPARFVGITQNVTARKSSDEKLRQSEAVLRSYYENAPFFMGITEIVGDDDILHVYDNPATCRFFGVEKDATSGRLSSELGSSPEVRKNWIKHYRESEASREPVSFKSFHKINDVDFWLSVTVSVIEHSPSKNTRFCYVAEDITGDKLAEERFQLVVESAPNALLMVNREGRISLVNSQAEHLFGYPREELLGATIESLVPERFRRSHGNHRADFFTAPEVRNMGAGRDLFCLRKDGSEVPVEIGLNPMEIAGDKFVLISVIDITERKRSEQALTEFAKRQEALYKLADQLHRTKSLEDVYQAALDAIISALQCDRASILLCDSGSVMRFVAWRGLPDHYRRAAEGHSPWKPDETNAQPIYISDITTADIDESLKSAITNEGIRGLAFIPLVSSGKLIGKFMAYSDTPREFTNNELELGLTIARQLAFGIERKRAEEQLRYQFDLTRTITDNTQSCLWMMDIDGRCTFANHSTESITGFKPEELIGKIFHEQVHHTRPDGTPFPLQECPLRPMLSSPEPLVGHEDFFIHKEGYFFPVRCNTRPIFKNGALVGMVLEVRDITEEKRIAGECEALLEREQQLRKQAEDANRLKDEFLATVSHELLTPLNAILGWATMARQNNFDQEVMVRAFEIIERNARNQNQIISDILDVSRIITGKLNLNLQPLELSPVIKAAIDTVRPAIDAKEINLKTRLEPDGKPVKGDADRLQQIIWNLLSNAVKFTPEGGKIQIALNYDDDFARITVSDNGSGIEPEFLPYVFDRFRQADSRTTRRHGGLGLGLAIVRHLVELHGGDVSVESGGAGSAFTVRLPLKTPGIESNEAETANSSENSEALGEQNSGAPRAIEGLKILVIDDEPDSPELADFILTRQGAKVYAADSVDRALEIFENENPDIIVSDIGMPEKDGYELIREIKLREKDRDSATPVLALTAYAREQDNRRVLESGFAAFLPKPVEPAFLIEKIIEVSKSQNRLR
jgi:PAS domain S-box-containing protein